MENKEFSENLRKTQDIVDLKNFIIEHQKLLYQFKLKIEKCLGTQWNPDSIAAIIDYYTDYVPLAEKK